MRSRARPNRRAGGARAGVATRYDRREFGVALRVGGMERGDSMKKSEFVDQVLKASGVKLNRGETASVVDTAFGVMGKAIREEKRFAWPGFGTFVVQERAARKGRNPRSGEEMDIEASRTVGFKPAPTLKREL